MRRREFIAGLGGAAAWPLAARAQQSTTPVIGFVSLGSADAIGHDVAASFRKGLGEIGYVEGQNVTVEEHGLEGQFDRLPALMTDLVRRRVGEPGPASRRRRRIRGRGERLMRINVETFPTRMVIPGW